MNPGRTFTSLATGALATLTVAVMALGMAPTAPAVTTVGFNFTNLAITSEDDGQHTFAFDWSTEYLGGGLRPGDGFEIIPNFRLMYTDAWTTLPLTVDTTEVGTCRVDHALISCTADERADKLPDDQVAKGHLATGITVHPSAQSGLKNGYTAPTITFQANNQPVEVDFPGGIAPWQGFTEALKLESYPSPTLADYIGWTATFNPRVLAEGESLPTPDGTTPITYTMEVTFPEDLATEDFQKFPWALRSVPSGATPRTLATTNGTVTQGYSVAVSGEGTTKTVTVIGAFNATDTYQLYMPIKAAGDYLTRGGYELRLAIAGHPATATARYTNFAPFPTNDAVGVVSVRASSTTDLPVPAVPAGAAAATITYDLPGDTKARDYPRWFQRNREIPDDASDGSYQINYNPSATYQPIGTFPAGTVVTFTVGDPVWKNITYDPAKTTITPERLIVTAGDTNRVTIAYEITGRTLGPAVSARAVNQDGTIMSSGGDTFEVNYRCTTGGQETDSGTTTGQVQGRTLLQRRTFNGDTCTFTVDPATAPRYSAYELSRENSRLEVTRSATDAFEHVEFLFVYLRPNAQPASQESAGPAAPVAPEPSTEAPVSLGSLDF